MNKVLVVFHSYRDVTNKLVEALLQGIKDSGGTVACTPANEAAMADFLDAATSSSCMRLRDW